MTTIAVFSADEDTVLLRARLRDGGFQAVGAYVGELQSGAVDLRDFVDRFHPDVVIYDLPRDATAGMAHACRVVGFLRGRPDSVAGLMTVDLLILSGSTAAAAIITRWLPEGEAPAFWAAGFVAMFLFGMLFLATWGQLVR